MNNLAKNIKRLRNEAEITQQELADKIHVSNSLVSHWEKGDREPNVQDLNALAKFFGCTTDDLLNNQHIKADISKPKQVIHIKDFKKDLRSKYLILKVVFVLISIGIVLFYPNGNDNLSIVFFLVLAGIIIIDIIACIYNKHYIKTYNVDLDVEVKFINKLDQDVISKDWNSKIAFTFFLFILSIIVLPIIFLLIQNNNPDLALTIISVVITLAIFSNFIALIIYEFRDNLKHKEIEYYKFNYRLRLFLRKTLIIIYEVVFIIVYTILIYYGRNNLNLSDLWVAIFFSPMLVFISHLLYIVELKTLDDFKNNII